MSDISALDIKSRNYLDSALKQLPNTNFQNKLKLKWKHKIERIDNLNNALSSSGSVDNCMNDRLLSNENKKRARFASLLSSSYKCSRQRYHPIMESGQENLNELDTTYAASHLRYSPYNKPIVTATNLSKYIHRSEDFGISAERASNLFDAHRVIEDEYVTIDEFTQIQQNENERSNRNHSSTHRLQYVDEPTHLAMADQTMPNEQLLGYIKQISSIKILRRSLDPIFHEESEIRNSLHQMFSRSALVAMGIVIEEMVRDFMVRWRKYGYAIEPTMENINIATKLQLQGCKHPHDITIEMILSRIQAMTTTNSSYSLPSSSSTSSQLSQGNIFTIVQDILSSMQMETMETMTTKPNNEDAVIFGKDSITWESFLKSLENDKPRILQAMEREYKQSSENVELWKSTKTQTTKEGNRTGRRRTGTGTGTGRKRLRTYLQDNSNDNNNDDNNSDITSS